MSSGKSWVRVVPCALLLILAAASPARARPSAALPPCTHYVSPAGDDGHPGTLAQPWATFQHAADMAAPGDTVCFRGGAYETEAVYLAHSGTQEAAITFAAYPGEQPLLDGAGQAAELLTLGRGVSSVRISGFGLQGFATWGLFLTGDNRHVHLDHLVISGGEAALRMTYGETEGPPDEGPVEQITLEDSVVQGSLYSALDCTPGPCNEIVIRRVEVHSTGAPGEGFYGSDGIEFARGYPVLVEDCYVHDNGGDGIDLNSRDRAGNALGVILRRNRVVRNRLNGIKLWAGGRMENNLVWGQGNCAVWVGTYSSTLEIVNNTVAYNMWDPATAERNWALVVGYPEELARPPVNLTLANNILAFNATPLDGGPTGVYLGPGVTLAREEHNLYFSRADAEITAEFVSGRDSDFTRAEFANGAWAAASGQGTGDLALDPEFVAGYPGADLHLREGSPAIDAGSLQGAPTHDLEGRARDGLPDLGAYEWRAAGPWAEPVWLPLIFKLGAPEAIARRVSTRQTRPEVRDQRHGRSAS
ncbi:MAG: right-handed parallel beta-helix repeat-containing protein [Anaerolineae bacterium]|nr:right-handed parallel beta-helix repeat-containing protein [Anaerolineae bacterium]